MLEQLKLAQLASEAASIASNATAHFEAAASAINTAAAEVEMNWKGNAGSAMYQALLSTEFELRKLCEQSQSVKDGLWTKSLLIDTENGAAGGR